MFSNIVAGAGVAVVAPAGPVPEERYRAGLQILAARYQLVHVFDPTLAQPQVPYLADPDAARAAALNRAIRDPQVQAIFCARGGYGSMRLLEQLDARALQQRRPLLVGFSDITALHAWAAHHGVPSVHGPVVTQLGELPPSQVEALFDLLEGRRSPVLTGLRKLVGGCARGPLLGGNLTLLSHLCGTPYQPRLEGRILLLEETNEAPYRLDRMLTQLRLAGLLQGLAAVLVGQLTGCEVPEGPPAQQVLEERLADLSVPVAFGAAVGHGKDQVALPFGVPAQLDADQGWLRFE